MRPRGGRGGSKRPPPAYFTPAEFEALVKAAEATPQPDRNRALLLVAWGTAARASEVCGMLLERVDHAERAITFYRRKRDDWLRVILPEASYAALVSYLNGRRLLEPVVSGPLFPSRWGRALTENGVWRIVQRCGSVAGLPRGKCHPHTLRRTRAQWLRRDGADLYEIQHLLGHASVAVTEQYLSFEPEMLERLSGMGL